MFTAQVIGSDGKKAEKGFICLKYRTRFDFKVPVASPRNPRCRVCAGVQGRDPLQTPPNRGSAPLPAPQPVLGLPAAPQGGHSLCGPGTAVGLWKWPSLPCVGPEERG